MIDFRKNVFKTDEVKLRKFSQNKLLTREESDTMVDLDDGFSTGVDVVSTIVSGDSGFDLNGINGEMGGEDLYNDFSSVFNSGSSTSTSSTTYDVSQDNTHKTGVWWKDYLFSPLYLMLYTGKKVIYDPPNKDDFISILKSLNTITLYTGLSSAFFWLVGLNFIFNLGFQTVTSGVMFAISFCVLKFILKEDVNLPFMAKKNTEDNSDSDSSLGMDIDLSALDMLDDGLDLSNGSSIGLDQFSDNKLVFDEDDDEDEDDFYDDDDSKGHYILPPSPIDISTNENFNRTILDVFKSNEKYQGVNIQKRKDLVHSFAPYLITNDSEFGKWNDVKPRSKEGTNILYAIFKGLGQMQNQFLKDDEKMIAIEIKSNPLVYKVSIELPMYFKEKQVKSNLFEIENMIKNDASDSNVSVYVSYVKGIWEFKFLRLDNKNLISTGDIFRFYDKEKGKTPLDDFVDEKLGMPILIGLKDLEYPKVIDFEGNTSGTIVGGANSGKSWFTFDVMLNFIIANDYNNMHFVVMDKKNSLFWTTFAKLPHVLGHHTDITKYNDMLDEVLAEMDRRKELIKSLNTESFKGLRQHYRDTGEYEKLKEVPLFTLIIDEITATMLSLKDHYGTEQKELYDKFKNSLSVLAAEGRGIGVRVILIGQRAIDTSVPKTFMQNSTFKFGMRMENSDDYNSMFGKDNASKINPPDSMGIGILREMQTKGFSNIKTLTLGGKEESQMMTLIRILGLEWVRRSIGQDDILNQPKGYKFKSIYNRDKFVKESLKELEEGRILSPNESSSVLKLDMNNISEKKEYEEIKPKKIENPFKDRKKSMFVDEDEEDELGYVADSVEVQSENLLGLSSSYVDDYEEPSKTPNFDNFDDLFNKEVEEEPFNPENNPILRKDSEDLEEYQPPSILDSFKSVFKSKKSKNKSDVELELEKDLLLDNEFNTETKFDDDFIEYPEENSSNSPENEFSLDFEKLMGDSLNKDDSEENDIFSPNFMDSPINEKEDKVKDLFSFDDDDDLIDTSLDNNLFKFDDDDEDLNSNLEDELAKYKPKVNIPSDFEEPNNYQNSIEDIDFDIVGEDIMSNEYENTEIVELEELMELESYDTENSYIEEIIDYKEPLDLEVKSERNQLDFTMFFDDIEEDDIDDIATEKEIAVENDTIFGKEPVDINDISSIFDLDDDDEEFTKESMMAILMESNANSEIVANSEEFKEDVQKVFTELDEDIPDYEITNLEDILEESMNQILAKTLSMRNKSTQLVIPEDEKGEYLKESKEHSKIAERERERQQRLLLEEQRIKKEREEFEKLKAQQEAYLKKQKTDLIIAEKQAKEVIEKAGKVSKDLSKPSNGINLEFTSNVIEDVPKLSIKKYIVLNGDKKGLKSRQIECSLLEEIYSISKINESLDSASIIKDGNFYITSI